MSIKHISAIIFWGAFWGLEEATLGHLLHITTFNLGWFLWFPFAYFFMSMVYKQTGKLNSILFTSMVAIAIKLVNLLMTTNLIIVICPAISILLEGISLMAVLKLFAWQKHLHQPKLLEITIISLFWRILYTVSILAIPVWIMPAYPYKTITAIVKFLLYEGLVNSIFIYGTIMLVNKTNAMLEEKHACLITYFKLFREILTNSSVFKDITFKPLASFSLLVIALIIQWVL